MDNKLRIKRVKEGIKLLEQGVDPADMLHNWKRFLELIEKIK